MSGGRSIECRTGGANGDYQVVVTFTNNIVSGSASLTSGSGSVLGAPEFAGNTMTINLTGIPNAQTIGITLNNVTNTYAQTLPSTTLSTAFLIGDSNGDGSVNSADVTQTRSRSGQSADPTNFRSDFNADGEINSADATVVRNHSGNGLTSAKVVGKEADNGQVVSLGNPVP